MCIRRPKRCALLAVAAAATFAALASSAVGADEPLLRYDLQVGQRITYTTEYTSETSGRRYEGAGAWTLWVVGANEDGSKRVLARARNNRVHVVGDERDELWSKVWYAWFDLFPDGRYTHNETLGLSINPTSIFLRLPADGAADERGWAWTDEHFWTTYEVQAQPSARDAGPRLTIERRSLTDPIYERTRTNVAEFDLARRLVRRFENTLSSPSQEERSRVTLHEVTTIPRAEAELLARQAQVYFAATNEYEMIGRQAADDMDAFDTRMTHALEVLESAHATVINAGFRAHLAEMIEAHPRRINYYRGRADRRHAIVGRPAPDWSLLDLDGVTHTLAGHRGQVVILDFWYRRCTWCVRSMPQLREIVRDLAGEPVIFLGMNTDKDLDDARFVVDAMNLNYTSLQAGEVPKAYRVQAYPTLIIIDRAGVVRGLHVGYTPDLRETIVAEVRALLQ